MKMPPLLLTAFWIAGLSAVSANQALDAETVDAGLLDRYRGMLVQLDEELNAAIPNVEDEPQVNAFLASDKLDAKLVKHVVLKTGIPEYLAEFAQQGKAHEQLMTPSTGWCGSPPAGGAAAAPFTGGQWQDSGTVALDLSQGGNIIHVFRLDAPQEGIAVKSFTLKPVSR